MPYDDRWEKSCARQKATTRLCMFTDFTTRLRTQTFLVYSIPSTGHAKDINLFGCMYKSALRLCVLLMIYLTITRLLYSNDYEFWSHLQCCLIY